jgi:hypothetical protein
LVLAVYAIGSAFLLDGRTVACTVQDTNRRGREALVHVGSDRHVSLVVTAR